MKTRIHLTFATYGIGNVIATTALDKWSEHGDTLFTLLILWFLVALVIHPREEVVKAYRQRTCRHVVYYMETMKARDASGMIEATCDKCGKVLRADCGLHLPAELRQRHSSITRPIV